MHPLRYNNIVMTLSEHIKQKRKKNALSQVELAERAGVGLRFVRDLEQGKQTLRMDKVNDVIRQMKSDGSLRQLHEKYGLVYAYE